MQNFTKFTSIAIALSTTFGILMHDIHLDKAAAVVSRPAYLATTGALESSLSPQYHTHVERASLPRPSTHRSSLPNVTPPREGDRRHVNAKKVVFSTGGETASYWPSI